MKVIQRTEKSDIATVYIAESERGERIEFVEATQPPLPLEKKWVLLVSTLFGCPGNCKFCDAGGNYTGKLSVEEMLFQIDYLIKQRFNSNKIDVDKFKIQFARIGEPALNDNVLELLELLPQKYEFKRFIPTLSTVAPAGTEDFFERLLQIKNKLYRKDFQLQFSIHSTDPGYRDYLMPFKKWALAQIGEYGARFYNADNRKITLNFALTSDSIVDVGTLLNHFTPKKFLIKITPVNPTIEAQKNKIESFIDPEIDDYPLITKLEAAGYQVILSIGELEENQIGSNCGQYIKTAANATALHPKDSYTYRLEQI